MTLSQEEPDPGIVDVLREIRELRENSGQQPGFDLFRDLRMERNELRHTTVLAWLLDPRGSHGLRAGFLKAFLQECQVLLPVAVRDFVVLPEFYLDEKRENRIDVLIIGTDTTQKAVWACAVEGKIDSKEGKGKAREDGTATTPRSGKRQLERYAECLDGRFTLGWRGLYLTLTEQDKLPTEWSTIQWGVHVAQALDAAVQIDSAADEHLREFLRRYHAFVKTLASDEVDEESGILLHELDEFQGFADLRFAALQEFKRVRDLLPPVEWIAQPWGPMYLMQRDFVDELIALSRPPKALRAEEVLKEQGIVAGRRGDDYVRVNVRGRKGGTIAFVPGEWDELFPGRKPFYYALTYWTERNCYELKLQCNLSGAETPREAAAVRALYKAAAALPSKRNVYSRPEASKLEEALTSGESRRPKLGSIVGVEEDRTEIVRALIDAQKRALQVAVGPTNAAGADAV